MCGISVPLCSLKEHLDSCDRYMPSPACTLEDDLPPAFPPQLVSVLIDI